MKDQQQQQQHHVDYNQSIVTHYKLGCCDAWKLHQQLLSPSPALNMVFIMVAIKILLKSVGWVYIFNVYKLAFAFWDVTGCIAGRWFRLFPVLKINQSTLQYSWYHLSTHSGAVGAATCKPTTFNSTTLWLYDNYSIHWVTDIQRTVSSQADFWCTTMAKRIDKLDKSD